MTALEARFAMSVGEPSRRFDLEVELSLERGVLVLFGPSGSGKSLTIQVLAGLVHPESGSIRVGDRTFFDAAQDIHVPAHKRNIGYVPQGSALFPFRDVTQNVLFGLPRRERRRDHPRIVKLMEEMEIAHLARARPEDLSGGERQRVALARALAVEPRLLLLDEPFGAIDVGGRQALRELLRETLRHHGTPAVFVTHDPREAIILGDNAVSFARGRTTGSGRPEDLLTEHGIRTAEVGDG